jgi:hypothetical protein
MKLYLILAGIVLVAAVANILFYMWFTRKIFGKVTFEKVPEEGYFVFRIAGKNFQYSIPSADYERSKDEPVPVPGTRGIYIYRGRIYEEMGPAVEEMTKRAGREAVKAFLERTSKASKE